MEQIYVGTRSQVEPLEEALADVLEWLIGSPPCIAGMVMDFLTWEQNRWSLLNARASLWFPFFANKFSVSHLIRR